MDQPAYNRIAPFIWSIADDVLRDLFKRGKYPDVILPMCVIRRMDAEVEPTATSSTRSSMQCVAVYVDRLDEDGQVDFKGKAKVFCRTYSFLSSVIPYSNAEWEKLSILLNLLTPKLPAPKEEDLSKGILEAIDMDSYRVEKKAAMKIALADEDAEIEPVPTDAGGRKPEPELDRLSNILKTFNEQFGTLFTDADRVAQAHPRRHRAEGRRRRGLPERQGEYAAHRAHGARPGAGQGDAAPAEGRHAGLQAVRRERVVQALRRRHGVCDHKRVNPSGRPSARRVWL